jgi:hypothetical protein
VTCGCYSKHKAVFCSGMNANADILFHFPLIESVVASTIGKADDVLSILVWIIFLLAIGSFISLISERIRKWEEEKLDFIFSGMKHNLSGFLYTYPNLSIILLAGFAFLVYALTNNFIAAIFTALFIILVAFISYINHVASEIKKEYTRYQPVLNTLKDKLNEMELWDKADDANDGYKIFKSKITYRFINMRQVYFDWEKSFVTDSDLQSINFDFKWVGGKVRKPGQGDSILLYKIDDKGTNVGNPIKVTGLDSKYCTICNKSTITAHLGEMIEKNTKCRVNIVWETLDASFELQPYYYFAIKEDRFDVDNFSIDLTIQIPKSLIRLGTTDNKQATPTYSVERKMCSSRDSCLQCKEPAEVTLEKKPEFKLIQLSADNNNEYWSAMLHFSPKTGTEEPYKLESHRGYEVKWFWEYSL